jgi:hypothetical protein
VAVRAQEPTATTSTPVVQSVASGIISPFVIFALSHSRNLCLKGGCGVGRGEGGCKVEFSY